MLVVLIEVAFIRLPGPNWKDKEWKKEVREQICDFLCIWILAWSMLPLRAIEPPFPCWLSASWSTRKVRRYFFNRRIFLVAFPGSNLLFWLYTPVGQARDLYIFLGRKESCLRTRCRHVCFSYCNMMALSVNLNLWKPDSTCDMKNLFSTCQLEDIQIRNQEIPEAGLRASLSNVYFLVWIWIDDKPNATFFCQKILSSLLSSSTSPSIKNACSFVNSCF